uniref:Uncharacterized protein n=1 Tax=Brassica oleracea TaxID=3712 RepID=A0A3P6CG19_BRAOL|nr:unnamed protein product [Brassica oleracea]
MMKSRVNYKNIECISVSIRCIQQRIFQPRISLGKHRT